MKLFIIGTSKIGKSSLARVLRPDGDFVSASDWVRKEFPSPSVSQLTFVEGRLEQFLAEIGEYSAMRLKQDVNICVRTVQRSRAFHHPRAIIEGVRNPLDFAKLYTPGDKVLLLTMMKAEQPHMSTFEEGIQAIQSTCKWLIGNKIMAETDLISGVVFDYQCGGDGACADDRHEMPRLEQGCSGGEPMWCCLRQIAETDLKEFQD